MFKVGDEVLVKVKIKDMSYVDMMYVCELVTNPDVCIRFKSPTECIVADKTYEKGLADAWELARKIAADVKEGGFSCDDLKEMFGGYMSSLILSKNTYEQALAKIEAYEKEKSEIKVGDVVEFYYETEEPKEKGVVTWVLENGVAVVWVSGETEHCKKTELTKTGKHIDIESLLRQIGE